ncbi:hypothetical protein SH203_02864 [Brevundimonas sp. SH203]|uniref:hypothetical protein n=1 Tax=Brevundimonas sp. SH203 TaxID=345167 RepID=UPI0009CCD0B6|nr:hypothetical protein [Brevundimonas sp. SH203]GAW42448.1 hypothetical protein SH203_02864 [Brevundimonas sp. SH203]
MTLVVARPAHGRPLSDEEVSDACRDAGLPGWRCVIRQGETADFIAALRSPDYCVVRRTGRMVVRYGRDAPDAFARAVHAALNPSTTRH